MDISANYFITENECEEEERLYLKLIKNGRKRKLERKVSKYKDKREIIANEQMEAAEWFINMCKSEPEKFNKIKSICCIGRAKHTSNRRRKYIKSDEYLKLRLNSIILKNRYILKKKKRSNGFVYFYTKDVVEFLALIYTSYINKKFWKFIDIPDVSYILRQLKKTGLDIYLNKK